MQFVGDPVKAFGFVGDRFEVAIFDLGLRLGRAMLALRRIGKAPHQVARQLGKLLELAAAAPFRYAGEARHALRHVGLKSDPPLLAVIADIDAGLHLPLDDVADRLVHFGGEQLRIVGLALLLRHQQLAQRLVARQAADVRGEDAIAAEKHKSGSGTGTVEPVIAQFAARDRGLRPNFHVGIMLWSGQAVG